MGQGFGHFIWVTLIETKAAGPECLLIGSGKGRGSKGAGVLVGYMVCRCCPEYLALPKLISNEAQHARGAVAQTKLTPVSNKINVLPLWQSRWLL